MTFLVIKNIPQIFVARGDAREISDFEAHRQEMSSLKLTK